MTWALARAGDGATHVATTATQAVRRTKNESPSTHPIKADEEVDLIPRKVDQLTSSQAVTIGHLQVRLRDDIPALPTWAPANSGLPQS